MRRADTQNDDARRRSIDGRIRRPRAVGPLAGRRRECGDAATHYRHFMILARVERTARRPGCRLKDNYRGCTVLGRKVSSSMERLESYMPSVEHLYQKTRQDVFVVHHFFEVLDLLLLFERDLAARLPLFFEPALSVW